MRLSVGLGGSTLGIWLAQGGHGVVVVAARPDPDEARACTAGARRVHRVELVLDTASLTTDPAVVARMVITLGRYRMLTRAIPLEAALALAASGVRTLVVAGSALHSA